MSASRPSRQEALLDAIERVESLLTRFETEQGQTRAQLAALRSELASLGPESEIRVQKRLQPPRPTPENPADKVKLFRHLFRGREDVFPTRFVSKNTGKPGYAPACSNKFVRGVCELPRIKCGECLNQAFFPVDDDDVLAHLKGRHVMGVYEGRRITTPHPVLRSGS